MRYDDVADIDTPEGLRLELPLAGVGSRFAAAIVDFALQFCIVVAVFFAAAAIGSDVVSGLAIIVVFLAFLGYDILFEVRGSGRTPGKRLAGLRVVTETGGPVDFRTSAVRNLVRLVDILPVWYLVGIVTILASTRNQRLGDHAAGTLVVREVGAVTAFTPVPDARPEDSARLATWDASAITAEELGAVRHYLERRASLTSEARAAIASELTRRLHAKVVGPPSAVVPDEFLVDLVAALEQRTAR